MDNNIKIVQSDGNVLDAVGISYIHIDSLGKDYIFYSLNELANGNMDKIYIAEASQNGTTPGSVSDEEWTTIKQIMLNISHNETVEGISYKPLIGLNFNVGDARKLAIKGDKKQAFIDAQNKAIAPTVSLDEPAFVSDQAANGSPFFASDVNATGATQIETNEGVQVQSAFSMQPPIAQEAKLESLDNDVLTNNADESVIVQQDNNQVIQPLDTQANQNNVIIQSQNVSTDQLINNTGVSATDSPITNPSENIAIDSTVPVQNSNENETMNDIARIEKELEGIQQSINNIKEYLKTINDLKPNKVVVNTTQVQTVSTVESPVVPNEINIAQQPEIKTDSLQEEVPLNNSVLTNSGNTSESVLIDTTSSDNVINTSVSSNPEIIAVSPLQNNDVETMENEEPVLVQNADNQPNTIVLNNVDVVSTPNSASDINNSEIQVAIPESPEIESDLPPVPISPLETNSIPEIQPVQMINNQSNISSLEDVQSNQITPTNVPEQPQQTVQGVQSVPEIQAVQQVPTLDLSSINKDVTLPTDMASNPNPNSSQDGVLGPATLDPENN